MTTHDVLSRSATTQPFLTASGVGRGLAAAGVLLSADVHLFLYFDGFSEISVVGPAFLLNAIGGLVIGVALLVWRHSIPLLLAIAFGVATLVAFYISATVGLFGVHETWGGSQVILAEVSEWVAIAGGVAALVAERRATDRRATDRRPTDRRPTDRRPTDRRPTDRRPTERRSAGR